MRAYNVAHRTTRRAAACLAAFVLVGGSAQQAAAQLAVDQVEMFLDPHALGRGVQSFNVSNESDQVVEATLYLNDWDRDEDGENRFVESGRLAQSCGRYLRVFPQSLRLPPHSYQAVRVALEGADSLRRSCWSVLFVESSTQPPAQGKGQRRAITYVTRLGVKIYVVPPNLAKDGDVVDVALRDSTVRRVVVTFRNTGAVPLWPHGNLEVRRLDGSVAATVPIDEFPVLPGSARRITIALPSLPHGRYVALALIDYGGQDIAGGQIQLDVP